MATSLRQLMCLLNAFTRYQIKGMKLFKAGHFVNAVRITGNFATYLKRFVQRPNQCQPSHYLAARLISR